MFTNKRLVLLLTAASVCGGSTVGCAQRPLGDVVPLRCKLPTPPAHPVAEQIVCELVDDFTIPEQWQQYIHETPDEPLGMLDLRNIEISGASAATPGPVAEALRDQLIPSDVVAQLQRIPAAEYRAEYWHSNQKVRYQSVVDGVPMPYSFAEFTVWHPSRSSRQVLAEAWIRMFRVVARGEAVMLLDARTAFERSHVWETAQTIEPVTRVHLRYLPRIQPGVGGERMSQMTFRPVWCFLSKERRVGDIITGQRFLVDAVTGTEFRQTWRQ